MRATAGVAAAQHLHGAQRRLAVRWWLLRGSRGRTPGSAGDGHEERTEGRCGERRAARFPSALLRQGCQAVRVFRERRPPRAGDPRATGRGRFTHTSERAASLTLSPLRRCGRECDGVRGERRPAVPGHHRDTQGRAQHMRSPCHTEHHPLGDVRRQYGGGGTHGGGGRLRSGPLRSRPRRPEREDRRSARPVAYVHGVEEVRGPAMTTPASTLSTGRSFSTAPAASPAAEIPSSFTARWPDLAVPQRRADAPGTRRGSRRHPPRRHRPRRPGGEHGEPGGGPHPRRPHRRRQGGRGPRGHRSAVRPAWFFRSQRSRPPGAVARSADRPVRASTVARAKRSRSGEARSIIEPTLRDPGDPLPPKAPQRRTSEPHRPSGADTPNRRAWPRSRHSESSPDQHPGPGAAAETPAHPAKPGAGPADRRRPNLEPTPPKRGPAPAAAAAVTENHPGRPHHRPPDRQARPKPHPNPDTRRPKTARPTPTTGRSHRKALSPHSPVTGLSGPTATGPDGRTGSASTTPRRPPRRLTPSPARPCGCVHPVPSTHAAPTGRRPGAADVRGPARRPGLRVRPCRREQLPPRGPGRSRVLLAGEHAGQFADPVLALQYLDAGPGHRAVVRLLHQQLPVRRTRPPAADA